MSIKIAKNNVRKEVFSEMLVALCCWGREQRAECREQTAHISEQSRTFCVSFVSLARLVLVFADIGLLSCFYFLVSLCHLLLTRFRKNALSVFPLGQV